jgi:hypothetical protein
MRLLAPPRSIFVSLATCRGNRRRGPLFAAGQNAWMRNDKLCASRCDGVLHLPSWETLPLALQAAIPQCKKWKAAALEVSKGYISRPKCGWVARWGPTHLLGRASQHVFRSREWEFLIISHTQTWESARSRLSSGCLDTRSLGAPRFSHHAPGPAIENIIYWMRRERIPLSRSHYGVCLGGE